jgi:hypothetical protein
VNDAGLHHGLRKHRRDRVGKALEPIDHRNDDVVDAARLELVDHLEPELGAFGLLDPQPQNVLLAVRIERERHVDGLVLDQALVANLDPQGVEKHHRIDRVERTVLPVGRMRSGGMSRVGERLYRPILYSIVRGPAVGPMSDDTAEPYQRPRSVTIVLTPEPLAQRRAKPQRTPDNPT